jgi:hypothetical protein
LKKEIPLFRLHRVNLVDKQTTEVSSHLTLKI